MGRPGRHRTRAWLQERWTRSGSSVSRSISQSAAPPPAGSSAQRWPQGPRRTSAVRSPAAMAGATSLTGWSPTYTISRGVPGAHAISWAKNAGSGLARPHSSEVAIASAGRSSSRSSAGAGGLVTRDADPQTSSAQPGQCGPYVGVEVRFHELLTTARCDACASFFGHVQPWPDEAQRVGVVAPLSRDGTDER